MSAPQRLLGWRTAAQILLWRHGWAWPLAVVVTGSSIALHFLLVEPAQLSFDRMRIELAQNPRSTSVVDDALAIERQLVLGLRVNLAQGSDPAAQVGQLLALARTEGVALTQGEYHEQFHRATEVRQIQVTQPVRASYPQVKRYIESVLRTMPHVSLDQVVARRENVGQAQLEVRLRWSIWIYAPAVPGTERTSAKGPL